MLHGRPLVDSTDFTTGGNENASSHSERRSERYDMPNCWLLKKVVQRGRRRDKTGGVPSGAHGATNKEHHVCARRRVVRRPGLREDFVEPRTELAGFFSSLLKDFSILTRVHPRLIGKS